MSNDRRRMRKLQEARRELIVPSANGTSWQASSQAQGPYREREAPGSWDEPPVQLDPATTSSLAERHRAWAGHHGVNVYKCDGCGDLMVTLDHDNGVTPAFLGCRATPGCGGRGTSSGYPKSEPPARILELLAWSWYRPGRLELAWLKGNLPEMADHVLRGGLALRPWREGDSSAYRRPYPPELQTPGL